MLRVVDAPRRWVREVNDLLLRLPSSAQKIDRNVILLGDAEVGKSSLALRFCHNSWTANYIVTIAVDLYHKCFGFSQVEENCQLRLHFWDTAGQERYHPVARTYYHGANVAILAFSDDHAESLERAKTYWMTELANALTKQERSDCLLYLVYCKADRGVVDVPLRRRALGVARELGAEYWETSAKTGWHVTELFHCIAARLFLIELRRRAQAPALPVLLPVAPPDVVARLSPAPPKKKECCLIM